MKRTICVAAAVVVVLGILAIYLALRSRDSREAVSVPQMSSAERKRLGLPLSGELTLATQEDMNSASLVDTDTRNAISRCIPNNIKWRVFAHRDTGQFVLLWIHFPDIMDGGIDLVYSKKSKGIICSFLGGYRG